MSSSSYSMAKSRAASRARFFETRAEKAIDAVPVAQSASTDQAMAFQSAMTTERDAQAYSLFRNWVYVSVNAIAKRLAGQPVMAGEIVGGAANPERSLDVLSRKHAAAQLPPRLRQKAISDQDLEVLSTHPVIDALCRPNSVQKKFEFLYLSAANLLLTGETYWVGGVSQGEDGEDKVELWAVPTTWITPIHDGGMFTGYKLRVSDMAEPIPLPPENVARTYFPDPSDIKSAVSPLWAVVSAVRTDDRIQGSQESMFERGINPNLIVTVGRVRGADGALTDRRPRLSGAQRRQLIRAVREIWGNTVNAGDPAIVDGLIESVHKLQMTPQEMDWLNSGDVVKRRIMQAFGVNPIVVGEIVGANRAQAVEADKQFCQQAVNPIGDALSETATDFLGPMYETPKRLVVWIEPCKPSDPDLELRRWSEARKNGDVTRNEVRTELLGLPPVEDVVDRNVLLSTVGGMTGSVQILSAQGNGLITAEQSKNLLMLFLEVDEEIAESIAGVGANGEPSAAPPPMPEPPPPEPIDEDDDELEDDAEELVDIERGISFKSRSPITRRDLQAIHVKQTSNMEDIVARSLARYFRESVKEVARRIEDEEITVEPDPERAAQQAFEIMQQVFDLEGEREKLREVALETLPFVFASGAISELELNAAILENSKTTAQEIARRLDLEVPDGMAIGQMPGWMRAAAARAMGDAFDEEYWQRIPETTRDDIGVTLMQSINEGHSIRRAARTINQAHGAAYSIMRATRVARTEVPNALNAGHAEGMRRLSEETGLVVGKEWVSVLGNTTRDTHANLDGQQTDRPEGLFSLGGVEVPWPAHHSLPARERINCQCTIVSALVMEQLEQDEPELSEAALSKMHAKDIVSTHPGLKAKQETLVKVGNKTRERREKIRQEQSELELEASALGNRLVALKMQELDGPLSDAEKLEVVDLKKSREELLGKQRKLWEDGNRLDDEARKEAFKAIATKGDTRPSIKVNKYTGKDNHRNERRGNTTLLHSTGNFSKEYEQKADAAKDFLNSTMTTTGMSQSQREALENLQAHSTSPGVRAYYADAKSFSQPHHHGMYLDGENDKTKTFVHEMGHHLENTLPNAQRRSNEFIDYRIQKAGRPNVNMKEVFGGGYSSWEVGNDDDFTKAFDKDYKPHRGDAPPRPPVPTPGGARPSNAQHFAIYTGKRYADGDTELLSQGVELLYDDPTGFAERDPEYCRFVLGVLDGSIR